MVIMMMMMIVMMMRSVEDFLWQKVISVGGGGGSGRCAQEVATACQGEDKRRKVNIDIDVIHLLNMWFDRPWSSSWENWLQILIRRG